MAEVKSPESHSSQEEGPFDVVHVRLLEHFPAVVAELGGNAATLLGDMGIENDQAAGHAPIATYRQAIQAIQLAAEQLNCPDFGMRLAVRQGAGIFGPLGQVMKNSSTFGEALNYVQSHA